MRFCRGGQMINICFDEKTYCLLLKILQEKYYSTTELNELSEINRIFKVLNYESESWLCNIPRKY